MSREIIILDTDMDTDCDDAGALAVLHALADRGDVEIAGVVCDVGNPWAAACIAAINRSCGRPEIPVGVSSRPYEENPPYCAHYRRTAASGTIYNEAAAKMSGVIPGQGFAPSEGVALYRWLLAAAEDRSVTVCAIGLLTVLADLLRSGPCWVSPLSGRELVSRKVKRLITMAEAAFPEGKDCFNWEMDRESAAIVLNFWPSRLTVNALGREVLTGGRICACLPEHNPVAAAYRIFGRNNPAFRRPSWDQITVLAAANACPDKLGVSPVGTLSYDAASGRHRWSGEFAGNADYVMRSASAEQLAESIEELMLAPFSPPVPAE